MPFTPANITLTKPSDASGFTPYSQSRSALAHSQQMLDTYRAEEAEAKKVAAVANSPLTIASETVKGTLSTFADTALKGIGSAIKAPFDIASQLMGGKPDAGANIPGFMGPQKSIQGEFSSETIPDVMEGKTSPLMGTLKPVGQTVLGAVDTLGAGGLVKGATNLLKTGVNAVKKPIASYLAQRAEKKGLESSIDAVYSSPTGAKLRKTSSQILSGDRKITPASMYREQGLTPDEQTINLGTRLKDLKLGKDSVKNTQTLADDFAKTEEKLQKALTGDPEIKYLADKQTLSGTLNKVKTDAPQEFRIKDSQSMVNRVVDFGQKVVAGADDSIGGIREARKAFDAQAKREFPSAFKPDGSIDTKTPAGYAIKKVRDDINEHLYNTAPNGSEIQALIGREADLYRATQVAVEKASSGQGKTALAQWMKENPAKARVLETAGILTFGATGARLLMPD